MYKVIAEGLEDKTFDTERDAVDFAQYAPTSEAFVIFEGSIIIHVEKYTNLTSITYCKR